MKKKKIRDWIKKKGEKDKREKKGWDTKLFLRISQIFSGITINRKYDKQAHNSLGNQCEKLTVEHENLFFAVMIEKISASKLSIGFLWEIKIPFRQGKIQF